VEIRFWLPTPELVDKYSVFFLGVRGRRFLVLRQERRDGAPYRYVLRFRARGRREERFAVIRFPPAGGFPLSRDSLGFGPGYPLCVLAIKPAAYGAGGVDGTVAPLPSAAELIGLVVSEIRRIARETFPSGAEVSSIIG
jgi:hypothetical protein